MQIIHDSNAVFDITINPFLQMITIEHIGSSEIHIWGYEELDDWHAYIFKSTSEVYDFHLLYEEHVEFSAYKVNDNKADYSKSIPLNLHLEF